jgi:acetyl-CoA acetyltransferase
LLGLSFRPRRSSDLGYFQREIVPVPLPQRKGDPILVDTDEHPRYAKTANGY